MNFPSLLRQLSDEGLQSVESKHKVANLRDMSGERLNRLYSLAKICGLPQFYHLSLGRLFRGDNCSDLPERANPKVEAVSFPRWRDFLTFPVSPWVSCGHRGRCIFGHVRVAECALIDAVS